MIYLQDILPLDELKKEGEVLLIRHHHEHLDKMLQENLVYEYQSFQNKKAFRTAKYIISFTAEPNNYGKFFGAFKCEDLKEKEQLPPFSKELAKYCRIQNREEDFYLELEKVDEFDKFIGRIIIDWTVPRGWYNTYGNVQNKEVIKILPRNFVSDFPGLMNIRISAQELKTIIENKETHTKWYDALTRLQAVYLILDRATGNQYVGTTYGQNGLWQRWQSYVKSNFTGGNLQLKKLKDDSINFYKDFQYSILEVLPTNANQKDCITAENLWKEKLGTRAFGLNSN
jgi:hypothetical protein